MIEGIDVSVWQPTTPDLTNLGFAFARACYGTHPDPMFDYHVAAFREAGIVAGAYAFGINGDGRVQARAFLDIAGQADLLALDLEAETGIPRMTDEQATAFIDTVQAAGRKIGLYHSLSGFPHLGQDWNWVAVWGTRPPAIPWTFWQYRGAPLDLDRFAGSTDELRQLAGLAGPADPWDAAYAQHATNIAYLRNIARSGGMDGRMEPYLAKLETFAARMRDGWAAAENPELVPGGIEV